MGPDIGADRVLKLLTNLRGGNVGATRSRIVFLTSIWKKAGGMPTANRGRRLRRLSPVTFYAALSELPRGADEHHKDAPEEAPQTPLLIVREPRRASPCMPRNCPSQMPCYECTF
jgi:hypothetical protein